MSNCSVGDRVEVINNGTLTTGTVRFIGATQFAAGVWVGVELDDGRGGKNDGQVQGVRYFDISVNTKGALPGVFMRPGMVKRVLKPAPSPPATTIADPISTPDTVSGTPGSASSKLRAPSPAKQPTATPSLRSTLSSSNSTQKPVASKTATPAMSRAASTKPPSASSTPPSTNSPQLRTSTTKQPASIRSSSTTTPAPTAASMSRTKTANAVLQSPPTKRTPTTSTTKPVKSTTPRPPALSNAATPNSDASDNPLLAPVVTDGSLTSSSSVASSMDLLSGEYVSVTDATLPKGLGASSTESIYHSVTALAANDSFSEEERRRMDERVESLTREVDMLQAKLRDAQDISITSSKSQQYSSDESNAIIETLKLENTTLTQKLSELEVIVQAQNDELEVAVHKRAEEVAARDAQAKQQADELKKMEAVIAGQVGEMQMLQMRVEKLSEEVEEERESRRNAEEAMKSADDRVKELEQTLEDGRVVGSRGQMFSASPEPEQDELVASLVKENTDLRAKLKISEDTARTLALKSISPKNIEAGDSNETELTKDVRDARSKQMLMMMKELEELRSRLKVTEEANALIEDETSREYEAKMSILRLENTELKQKLQTAQDALVDAEAARDAATKSLNDEGNEEAAFEIASLKDQVESLQSKLHLAEIERDQNIRQSASETAGLSEKVGALSKENETLRARIKLSETGLSLIDANQAAEAQITTLTEQVADLQFRLKAAEAKRSHDRDHTKEIDKLRQELGTTGVMKQTAQERIASLQAEVHKLTKDKEMLETQLAEANDALESVTLDHELEQERAESLQAELQALKDQVDELNMDLDFVVSKRPEIELNPEQFEGVVTEINLLNNQNERLKDALLQFRDFSASRERDLGSKIEELEAEVSKLLEQQENDSLIYLQLLEAETQIENLKETVDENAEAAALVEYLTTKNLELGQKIDELKDAVEDMEILQSLTDELEENHVMLEQDLIEEIDAKDGMMEVLKAKINSQEETVADYERTIHQFRELVKTLQDDLTNARMGPGLMSGQQGDILQDLSRDLSSIDLLDSGVKAQYKGIDMELRKLDVSQANEHLDIVKIYLPESFFKSEHVPILSLLLLRRIVFKTTTIKMFLEDNFLSVKEPGQIAFIAELRHKLFWAMGLARRLVAFLEGCSEDVFVQFSSSYTELIATERKIDVIIELLKLEEVIGQRGVLVEMQKCISHLEILVDMFLKSNSSQIDLQRQSMFYIDMVDAIADRFEAEMRRLEAVFEIPATITDAVLKGRIIESKTEFLKTMPSITQGSQRLRSMTRKLHRFIDKIIDSNSVLSDELVADMGYIHKNCTISIDYLAVLAGQLESYVAEQFELKDTLSLALMNQLASNASEALLKMPEDQMGVSLVTMLMKTNTSIMSVLENIEDPMNIDPVTESRSPPWLARASKIKSDYLLNGGLENVISSLKVDILELVTDLNEKKQLQAESQIKIELLERKHADAEALSNTITSLETRIKKLMENERAYMETVEGITKEKTELEHENELLKQNALRFEKMTSPPTSRRVGSNQPSPYKKGVSDNVGSTAYDGIVIDGDVAAQFEALKSALRFLRIENTKLKADMVAKTAAPLFKPVDPLMRRGLSNMKINANVSAQGPKVLDVASSVVAGLTRDSKNLIRDIQKVSATPAVVDISMRDSQPGKWVSMQKDPLFQHQRRVEAIDRLVQRGEDLQDNIKKVSSQIEETTGRALLPKPTSTPILLGRITVPKVYADVVAKPYVNNDKCNIVLTSRKQWESLHAMFTK
ncbi:hypothetical protein HDU79_005556 [Rhizoclosmatium sp. JEL0117]|nr:hypothetical protein HDU79_005556 [Rhizoclosmatium sp. JEL0117]